MTRKGSTKPSDLLLRSISTGGTYRIDSEVAIELEIYAKIGKHGSKKSILEQALQDWCTKNPLKPDLRNAALLLLEAENESK